LAIEDQFLITDSTTNRESRRAYSAASPYLEEAMNALSSLSLWNYEESTFSIVTETKQFSLAMALYE